MSILSTTLKILSIILLSKLPPYAEEFNGDHQCGYPQNRSTTDHIVCICQIFEKKWEYNEAVHQLYTDFKKVYDSVRREGNTMKQCISYIQTSRKPTIQSEGRSCTKLTLSLVHKTNMANKNVSK